MGSNQALHHAIQDLIDSGLVNLAGPSVTTNPLPTHSTHAVPPPPPSLQYIDLGVDGIDGRMVFWDISGWGLVSVDMGTSFCIGLAQSTFYFDLWSSSESLFIVHAESLVVYSLLSFHT